MLVAVVALLEVKFASMRSAAVHKLNARSSNHCPPHPLLTAASHVSSQILEIVCSWIGSGENLFPLIIAEQQWNVSAAAVRDLSYFRELIWNGF